MFAIELYLFSIGTIAVLTHIEPIPTTNYIPNTIITKFVIKKPTKSIGVLAMKLVIPPNIIK
jgi:hypothetical protein